MTTAGRLQVGVDTGGTFTDLVGVRDGALRIAKVPSTPPDFERGSSTRSRAAGIDAGRHRLLAHGTTVDDQRDHHETGAPHRAAHHAGSATCSSSAATTAASSTTSSGTRRRRWCRGATASRSPSGSTYDGRGGRRRSTRRDVARRGRAARGAGVGVGRGLLPPLVRNPAHEERMRRSLEASAGPRPYVVASADLLREPQEFERTSTTVVNAYLGPSSRGYLDAARRRACASGASAAGLLSCTPAAACCPAASCARVPARTVTSGPAAGVDRRRGDRPRRPGGEQRHQPRHRRHERRHRGRPRRHGSRLVTRVRRPSSASPSGSRPSTSSRSAPAAARSPGSTPAARPSVGPQSAGAGPGPAAYGRGGDGGRRSPTRTSCWAGSGGDAALAGGLAPRPSSLARAAVRALRRAPRARRSRRRRSGIVRIANANMARWRSAW